MSRFRALPALSALSVHACLFAAVAHAQCLPQWRPFGQPESPGLSGFGVFAVHAWDSPTHANTMIVGGLFTAAGGAEGTPAPNITSWDGSSWSPLGSGTNGAVYALHVMDLPNCPAPGTLIPNQLIVGGAFTRIGSVSHRYLARWDGSAWHAFPAITGYFNTGGEFGSVQVMTTFDPDADGPLPAELIIAGEFSQSQGVTLNAIARWDGCAFRPLGTGLFRPGLGGARPESITLWDSDGPAGPLPPKLVVSGLFSQAGGQPAQGLASWDGQAWTPIPVPAGSEYMPAVAVFDFDGPGPEPEELVVACNASITLTSGGTTRGIARYNGQVWRALGDGLLPTSNNGVSALLVWQHDRHDASTRRLYAGGAFNSSGTTTLNKVAMWDGAAWQNVSGGVSAGNVLTLHAWNIPWYSATLPCLLVGGDFTAAGSVSTPKLAMYDCPAPECIADYNADGIISVQDMFSFLAGWFSGESIADTNRNSEFTVQDIFDFLALWFVGC